MLFFFARLPAQAGCFEKSGKERMGRERTGEKLRMKLCPEHEGVYFFGELGYLHEVVVRRYA